MRVSISPVDIAKSKQPWTVVFDHLEKKDGIVHIPFRTPDELSAVKEINDRMLVTNAFSSSIGTPLSIHFVLDASQESHEVLKVCHEIAKDADTTASRTSAVQERRQSEPLYHPTITISQGVVGGAAIGGVAGLSAFLVAESLKQFSAAIGNPICGAIGMVLAGLCTGATGGVLVSTYKKVQVKVGPYGVDLQKA